MDKILDKKISDKIIKVLKQKGLNQTFLSTLLGIRPSSVSDIINGKSPWRLKHIVKVSMAFRIPLDILIYGKFKLYSYSNNSIIEEANENYNNLISKSKKND
ncbi:MAG TPA: helix-turn-helix transcriptional regulator [Ignavibacteria bacterium]|nr:helix-turn-helix transcriptional regulator [Ignavibacteria bacterium]